MAIQLAKTPHKHTQSTPSSTWTITHNLDVGNPVVDCWYNSGGVQIKATTEITSITSTSNDVVVIEFTAPISGRALVTG